VRVLCACVQHKSLRGPRGAMIFYRKGVQSVDKAGKRACLCRGVAVASLT
jgi:glycine/serine hydroxymethyltransferase